MKTHSQTLPADTMTCWPLIRKVTAPDCDEASWAEFDQIYRKLVYGVARKMGLTHEEAEDAVQETMAALCEKIQTFVPDPARGSFKSWLLEGARWRIVAQFRKRENTCQAPLPDDTQMTPLIERIADPASLGIEESLEKQWQQEMVEAATERVKDQVSPDQFQIFDFAHVRQMPLRKVARSLGVNIGQVYLARHRVTKLIKKEVRKLEKTLAL